MEIYINKLKISGIKNIKQPIKLEFYNKTIVKPINLEGTNIKAIYGANGSGKSAIIHAVDIYKSILSIEGYLYTEEARSKLKELINKECKTFSIEVSFFTYEKENSSLQKFRHELIIKSVSNDFYIEKERLVNILTQTEKTLIDVNKGKITEFIFAEEFKNFFINKLDRRSVIDVFYEGIKKEKELVLDKNTLILSKFIVLCFSIYISTEDIDKHELFFSNIKKDNINRQDKEDTFKYKINSDYIYIVPHEYKEILLKEIKQMEQFIKIFKPDLIEIETDIKSDREYSYIELYFVYDGYKVFLKFESAGIKKLTNLYRLFKIKESGGIVFIDELDANINDVYLNTLLGYFKESNKGQLVFTTHSISPMEILESNKHSIDFITEKGEITSWVRSGNSKAGNVYQKGLVKGLPFNIYPFDFVGVFDGEDNES